MSRTVSATFRAAAYAQQTSEVFLFILQLDHEDLETPIRVVNNQTAITSGGNEYTPFPFMIDFPQDDPEELPQVRLTIDNCARELTASIRALDSAPTATLSVVLASTPNVIEAGPMVFSMQSISISATSISAILAAEDMLNAIYPKDSITPANFPGGF
jgi:hypothetical protein